MEFKKITFDDIVNYCKEHNEIAWLKEEVEKKVSYVEDGETKERDISFIEVKNDFVAKFMPAIAPKRKPKKGSMKDIVAGL
jgi:hypothetical protein